MRKTLYQLLSQLEINPHTLEQARQRQVEQGGMLREHLIELRALTPEAFSEQVSQHLRVPYIDLETRVIPDDVLKLLSREKAERYLALPFELNERHRRLSVTMADPTDMSTIDELKFVIGYTVIPHFTPEDELIERIHQEYTRLEEKEVTAPDGIIQSEASEDQGQVIDVAALLNSDVPVSQFIGQIFSVASTKGAHEIAIGFATVKFFVVGKGCQSIEIAPSAMQLILSRFKRLFALEVGDPGRLYSKGHAVLKGSNKKERTLSYLVYPTVHGEEILIKLNDPAQLPVFDELAMDPRALQTLHNTLQQPFGSVLVTGTARSGVTTTLYTLLQAMNTPQRHILSIEYPVECYLEGVFQGQVAQHPSETFTQFIDYARAQHPDILMIDAISEPGIAKQIFSLASEMFVLSSLMAVDTASAVIRLACLCTPETIAERVNCLTSQRLVRKICQVCKEKIPLAQTYREKLGFSSDDECYAGKGCEHCEYTGYEGVLPLFEVMLFTPEIRQAVLESQHVKDLRHLLVEQGQVSLREDGMRKVKHGLTTVQEVLKATML